MIKILKNGIFSAKNKGFAIMFALIIGAVLLILSVSLYSFMGHQRTGVHAIVDGEVAHFLAEAGISSSIRGVRDALDFTSNSSAHKKITDILKKPGKLDDINLNSILKDTWNDDLKKFSAEVDKKASIEVNVWLRGFKQLETNPKSWVDKVSREGFLSVESTGYYKGFSRTIAVKRKVKICNVLPPVLSKFTLFIRNASKSNEGKFNIMRNDYNGTVSDGPQPLLCYNHSTPDSELEAISPTDVINKDKNKNIWTDRGWIWLGGKKVRLNLCSGAGKYGEVFQFYDVSNLNQFTPVKFVTAENLLPDEMKGIKNMYWDIPTTIRKARYSFNHSFVVIGFHDKSDRKQSNAMYEGRILSTGEKLRYTSKSSVLHLFGDAKKGYQSRTKIFGPVYSAFARMASLGVKPEDPEVASIFNSKVPPPLYLLPSVSRSQYADSSFMITEAQEMLTGNARSVGGPIIKPNMIFGNYKNYSGLMSKILELPYVYSYNMMQDIIDHKPLRVFPASKMLLKPDNGKNVQIVRGNDTIHSGPVNMANIMSVMDARIQENCKSIDNFWEKYMNKNNELELNSIVSIENPEGRDFIIPAPGMPTPLSIKGGGMIIVNNGNLIVRGIKVLSKDDALSIVMKNASSVRFDSVQTNMVNIIAPKAELIYSSRLNMYGTLCVGSIYIDQRFQGGKLRYRELQDPTKSSYDKFYKIQISQKDSYWYE